MESRERIIIHTEDIRSRIMQAALQLSKKGGWKAVSIRKIAGIIEYSAPAIYGYFNNKEDLRREFTRQGFLTLSCQLTLASGAVISETNFKTCGLPNSFWSITHGLILLILYVMMSQRMTV